MFCNPNGVCAGTAATCTGMGGWVCNYPMTFQATETRCDNLDNDCDGMIDEPFPTKGTACNNGALGACRRTGMMVCNMAGTGVVCNAAAPPAPTPEVCNGIDDDCDGGTPDEGAPDLWVQFTSSTGADRWVYQYEASRPYGTAMSQGTATHRPCSAAGRLPWTNVTRPEAEAACVAIGARLCRDGDWQRACETDAGTPCDWSYASMCTTYQDDTCNGNDFDTNMSMPGDQDAILPTGTMTSCYARWGAAMSNRVFDLSGNVEEWTRRAGGINHIRGGSNNDSAGGLRCDFDFVVADELFRFPNVGFRCCRDSAP
jgi:hypothetical protein